MKDGKDIATLLVVLAALLLVASNALGQECRQRELSSKPFYMPTGLFCQIGEEGMTCFTLEEYKKLLEMDHKLHTEEQKAIEYTSIIENQGLIIQQKDVLIESLEKDKTILEQQSERLGEKWRTCLNESEGFPWDTVFWGAGAGLVVGITAAVITYLTLSVPERAD